MSGTERPLGKSDVRVPALGVGTNRWNTGEPGQASLNATWRRRSRWGWALSSLRRSTASAVLRVLQLRPGCMLAPGLKALAEPRPRGPGSILRRV